MKTRWKRCLTVLRTVVLLFALSVGLCLAEEGGDAGFDLLGGLNKLKELIFTIISTIGGIITLFGVFQFGTSFPAHDPTQRTQGLMYIAGGLIVAAAPWVVNYILA